MSRPVVLPRTHYVFLKENGEVCNRLRAGTKVLPTQVKGQWVKITWRNGKKKGWIKLTAQEGGIEA